jgi:hypothetical protein
MKFILHVFFHGHPMLKCESLYELFKSLAVLNNLSMHWYDIVGWVLVKFMYMQVQNTIVKAIQSTIFIACSCDEVTTIDNGSWICVHDYEVDSWIKVLILFCVERIVDGSSSNNLIEVIMAALMKGGGLTKEDVAKNLCFCADGAFGFQGGKTGV